MTTDDAFNKEFKPLHIPSAYRPNDSWKDQVIFALAELGAGTAEQTAQELHKRDAAIDMAEAQKQAQDILNLLFNKGLIKGGMHGGEMVYNLSKITIANSGSTHPSHEQ